MGLRRHVHVGALFGARRFVLSCTLPRPPALRIRRHRDDDRSRISRARTVVGTASFAMVCYGVRLRRDANVRAGDDGALPNRSRRGVLSWRGAWPRSRLRVVLGGASDRFGRRSRDRSGHDHDELSR